LEKKEEKTRKQLWYLYLHQIWSETFSKKGFELAMT
jgi:hypothetical protein